MARRLSSPIFVGRSEELQTLLSTADLAADGHPGLVLVGGEAGVGKSRLVRGGRRPSARSRLAGHRGWRGRARRGRAPVRPDRRSPSLAGPPGRPRRDRRGRRTEPARARPTGPRGGAGRCRGRPAGPDRMAPDPDLRGRPAPVRQARRDESGPARHRGHALGRPFDPRPARVPDAERARRATADGRDLPQRRTAPPSSIDSVAGRDRAPAARRARRPGAVRAWRSRRTADRHRRCATGRGSRRLHRPALRRERVLRRGTRRRRRGAAPAAASACPRPCAASSRSAWRPDRRPPAGWSRSRPWPAGRSSTSSSPRSAGCPNIDLGLALRSAIAAQLLFVDQDGPVERYRFRHALVQEAAYDGLLPSERRVLHAAYARAIESAIRPAPGSRPPPGSSRSPITGGRHRTRPAPSVPRSRPATPPARSTPTPRPAGSTSARSSSGTSFPPPTDRPTGTSRTCSTAASATATLVGDASHAVDLAQRAIELIDADSADDRGRRARARERVRVRVVAGRRYRHLDPFARGGHRPARRGVAVDR